MWALGAICYYLLKGRHPVYDQDIEDDEITSEKIEGIDRNGLSHNARDFMEKLIVWDPWQRMSALVASTHPWLL
ncbi:hypothetical protein EMPS_05627 [Entomortierella parvispora]|uniref:Protein kinase domain-containing protein n=1 Tax=Entomortierella parvispora TaxID=205924 RepID=A0A9P3LWP7_9FUNG|nr:hypothetical protein EMPS_05627 [Entomortierella parvispora]